MWATLRRLSLGFFLIALAAAILLLSDTGRRRPEATPARRVAILQHSSQVFLDECAEGMIAGLAEGGWVDGQNLRLRRYNSENDLPTANAIAKEIASAGYDLVLTVSTLSMQSMANANRAGKTIHVFAAVSDPYDAGVGVSRADPLQHPRHLVGYATMQPVAETFRLARRLFPGLKRVGVVWNPAEVNSEVQTKVARATCAELGIDLVEATVDATSGVMEAASSLAARGVQALWVGGDVTVMTAVDAIVAVARKGGIPVFTNMPGQAARGTLFDLGADYREVGRRAGILAAEILNGRDPATVPVENILPEQLVIDRAALTGLHDPWRFPDDVARSARQAGEVAASPTREARVVPPAGRVFKVGVVYFAPDPGADISLQGLRAGLRDLGFVAGKNLQFEIAHAQGEIANIPALLQNYDNQGLDLIVPLTTPCLTAACGIVKNTPVVFTYVYDPIAAGAGTSFTDHLANVTGVGSFPPVADTVTMIQRLLPGVTRVGTIYNSSEANSRKVIEVARDVFRRRGIQLEEVSVTNSSEVFQAAQALAAREVQAFWITGDNTAIQAFSAIVGVAKDARLPIINNDPELVPQGALACVGIGFYQSGYAAAKLAARVLLGANPADVPMENVAVKTVSLNLSVAQKLGITFPESLLRSADVLIDASGVHPRSVPPTATPRRLAKTWKLDLLQYVNVVDVEEGERGIRAGLEQAGLVEGRDFRLTVRNAQGDMPTLSMLVDAALSQGCDLLLTQSTPTLQAALQRAQRVPIVFTFVANAVLAGAGRSNEDHLANVTGVPTQSAYEALIAAVRECLPAARRIGTLFVPAEVNSVFNKDQLTKVAQRYGIEVVAVAANTSSEMADAALALCNQPLDAVVQIAGNVTTAAFASIAQAAARVRLPLFGSLSSDAHEGAAVVVARDYYEGGREAGVMAARVMRGESPGSIPFTPLAKTKVIVNLDAARATGLTVPPSLLRRADEVLGHDGAGGRR